ncbi:MAG TPA: bifunctional oligoribonuclease/PAP phosphatase NrnA, partial [Planctomycetaceae bacterium]|nr:bifunctional oligoribonuclease/PAP phosphatase NrnA [Planctomycetaceae bacterium]
GEVKVSFRSRSLFNCSEMASRFGGGGHKAAAGAMVEGPLEAARERVLEAVREEMTRLAGTR